jgi:hypothetical protein
MNPVYLDLHIHTSEDPNNLNEDYELELLLQKIDEFCDNSNYLISLTDHNTVNKNIYLKAKNLAKNIILGVELHINNYTEMPPYHCHIYFKTAEITEEIIDDINSKLDELYPNKVITSAADSKKIEMIIKAFDAYDFLLLPHGGQNHSTFNKSILEGVQFDDRMQRAFYYNQFDGFTARNEKKLEVGIDYFKKLKISEFVNLITCTDNYQPSNYPNPKDPKASDFIPTWMLAEPTFNGLRLSLSESSRLIYGEKPNIWSRNIESVGLHNENIDIDVKLTSGLNVIIGGSSSGKTLFVESLYSKIQNDFTNNVYTETDYGVENIAVSNPPGILPHYIPQSYITTITSSTSDDGIGDINIIKNVFPGDTESKHKIDKKLTEFNADLKEMVSYVKSIEDSQIKIKQISTISGLITSKKTQENILKDLLPNHEQEKLIGYSQDSYQDHIEILDQIEEFMKKNPLVTHDDKIVGQLKAELLEAYQNSTFERKVNKVLKEGKNNIDIQLVREDGEHQSKKQEYEKLLGLITTYSRAFNNFNKILVKISQYDVTYKSQEIISSGHKLYIENNFALNKTKFTEIINHFLKSGCQISNFDEIRPEDLFQANFKKQSPKVNDYDDFENKIYEKFVALNKRNYRIITNDGRDFQKLSAGWKTSIIIDLILGYEDDLAPLIIDQPEDNLATNYINEGLVKAVKKIKSKKQIILVSHNATIPMLGDAQNVILCQNNGGKILISSAGLEGSINGKDIVDHIAEITDGGKISIKKRVKKYNLKKFNE